MNSSIHTVLEVRLRHEPGTLARLASAIAGQGGLRLIASRTEPGELVPSPLARELHEAIAAGVVKPARKTGTAGTAAP
jgi:hypothetical protein